jgi:hypothetical protein
MKVKSWFQFLGGTIGVVLNILTFWTYHPLTFWMYWWTAVSLPPVIISVTGKGDRNIFQKIIIFSWITVFGLPNIIGLLNNYIVVPSFNKLLFITLSLLLGMIPGWLVVQSVELKLKK